MKTTLLTKEGFTSNKLLNQLTTSHNNQECEPRINLGNLTKRAKSKHITNKILYPLIDLNSELKKSYWNTHYCNVSLLQSGRKITGRFCNNRWCCTCNRIRTMKLLKGYEPVLKRLTDKYFVTLTVPNVSENLLKDTVNNMFIEFIKIQKTFQKRKTPIRGIRKIECTYNPIKLNYHPHFHLIVSGSKIAENVVNEWVKRVPNTNRLAQDYRVADDGSVIELFKYFTKLITGKGNNRRIYIVPMDNIFKVMRGRRVFQPLGIKKDISEDINEIQSQEYEIEEGEFTWWWENKLHDWVNLDSTIKLSGYIPSEKEKELYKNIILK
jgi:hypothetical protein